MGAGLVFRSWLGKVNAPLTIGPVALAVATAGLVVSVVTVAIQHHRVIDNPSLQDALSLSQEVNVGYVSGGNVYPMAWINRKKNAGMLDLLHSVNRTHAGLTSDARDVLLRVHAGGRISMEKEPTLWYSTTTGRVWLEEDYAYVPDEFRKWLREVYVNTPKQRFRTRSVGPITFEEPILPPPPPPLALVEVQSSRWHSYTLLDAKNRQVMHNVLAPYGSVAYEAEFYVGSDPKVRHMFVRPTAPCWQWPSSYVGKSITYRFRWKYRDGTYGPWSKAVSAKVLP